MKTDIAALKKRVENAITKRRDFWYVVEDQGRVKIEFMNSGQAVICVFTKFATTRSEMPAESLSIRHHIGDEYLHLKWDGNYIAINEDGEFIEI